MLEHDGARQFARHRLGGGRCAGADPRVRDQPRLVRLDAADALALGCVAGAGGIVIDYKGKKFVAQGVTIKEGDWISLNGSTGAVYKGSVDTVDPKLTGPFGKIMALADKYRKLGVRTNADTPHDTAVAVKFGAEGIGLCRTEHMFFEGKRIVSFRRLILVAETVKSIRKQLELAEGSEKADLEKKLKAPLKQYNKALKELLPLQRADFVGIFKALKGRPCTVRLLDPPLHEFLPHDAAGQKKMAATMGVKVDEIEKLVDALHEFNPMLGHRGCRLGMTYPEVTAMQARAICEAACLVKGSNPEIMVPLVGHVRELAHQKAIIKQVIKDVQKEKKQKLKVMIGTMIEVPRAAMTADEIAGEAEFFSFGTNDLTQMGCGFSRDDAAKFLGEYVKQGIFQGGGTPVEFGTIAACDGIAQGHKGNYFILPSRDLIANEVEVMIEAHRLDGLVLLGSCDKIVPGMLMAAARLDIPTIMVVGGPMEGGCMFDGRASDGTSITESLGMLKAGKIDGGTYRMLEDKAEPTCGSCSFLGTANTMCCLAEALGLSMPGSATIPATYADRLRAAQTSGRQIVTLIEQGITARKIINQEGIENAIRVNSAIGGSTNVALHMPAIAYEAGFASKATFNRVFKKFENCTPTEFKKNCIN